MEHEARRIARRTTALAQDRFGADLRAAFLLGSLAHGGFAPLGSPART